MMITYTIESFARQVFRPGTNPNVPPFEKALIVGCGKKLSNHHQWSPASTIVRTNTLIEGSIQFDHIPHGLLAHKVETVDRSAEMEPDFVGDFFYLPQSMLSTSDYNLIFLENTGMTLHAEVPDIEKMGGVTARILAHKVFQLLSHDGEVWISNGLISYKDIDNMIASLKGFGFFVYFATIDMEDFIKKARAAVGKEIEGCGGYFIVAKKSLALGVAI